MKKPRTSFYDSRAVLRRLLKATKDHNRYLQANTAACAANCEALAKQYEMLQRIERRMAVTPSIARGEALAEDRPLSLTYAYPLNIDIDPPCSDSLTATQGTSDWQQPQQIGYVCVKHGWHNYQPCPHCAISDPNLDEVHAIRERLSGRE